MGIQFKRGSKDKLPASDIAGRPLYTTDTHELFIANGDNVELTKIAMDDELKAEEAVRIAEDANLSATIANEVITLNTRIDTEVATINDSATANIATLNTRIDTEIAGLNTTITENVVTLNTRIDAEVTTLNATIGDTETELTVKINDKFNTLNTSIINNVNTLNTTIDEEVATLNNTILTNVSTLNATINNEVNTLYNRIDTEVATLNETITNNVSALNATITSTETELTNLIATKVDKIEGKQLSTEDYTTLEKTKLSGIEENANNYTHPVTHEATMIVEDTLHRFVTDTEKATWNTNEANAITNSKNYTDAEIIELDAKLTAEINNKANIIDVYNKTDADNLLINKVDKVSGKGLSTEDYTTIEKTKLASLENYVHPATHEATIIVEDTTHRFMTDDEKTKLNGIEANANNYIHPENHAATMIVTDETHRFVTDAQISTWNSTQTYAVATQTANGLMSSTDKVKVDTLTISSTQVGINAATITSSQSVSIGQQSGVSGASGSNTAVGYNASAKVTNGSATAIGANANAGGGSDQGYGTAIGANAIAYNIGVAVGSSSNGSGKGVAIGYSANTNSKNYAIAKGYNTVCQRWNEEWKCSDGSSSNKYGYGQNTWYVETTNATQTEIFLGGTTNQRFTILTSSIVNFTIQVAAFDLTNNVAKSWKIEGAIKKNATTTSIVGNIVKTILAQDTGADTWDVIVSADNTNSALKIEVIGAANKTIRFNATASYSEARF